MANLNTQRSLESFSENYASFYKQYEAASKHLPARQQNKESIEKISFDHTNSQIEKLPTWKEYDTTKKNSLATPMCIFSLCASEQLKNPKLLALSPTALNLLDLKTEYKSHSLPTR